MFLKNNEARLISINFKDKRYSLMPAGKAAEVPDAAKKNKFVATLIESNSVSVVEVKADINDEQIKLVAEAIANLGEDDFTQDKLPKIGALESILDFNVTSDMRAAALALSE